MKNSKLKNATQIYFIGVLTRIAFLTGTLSLFYGMFLAPIFLVSDYVIMGVVLIGVGIYLNKVFKQKSKNKKSFGGFEIRVFFFRKLFHPVTS